MSETDDPYPPARPSRTRRWRAPAPTPRIAPYAPGACVPQPPSAARARHDGGDAGSRGAFWAVLRGVLAATAGR